MAAGIDPTAVTARSNSALCNIDELSADTSLSSEARMELIRMEAAGWDVATKGASSRYGALREAKARRPLIVRLATDYSTSPLRIIKNYAENRRVA